MHGIRLRLVEKQPWNAAKRDEDDVGVVRSAPTTSA